MKVINLNNMNEFFAHSEGEKCNNDISEQIAFEKKIAMLIKKANQVEKQLIEVKYYLEQYLINKKSCVKIILQNLI